MTMAQRTKHSRRAIKFAGLYGLKRVHFVRTERHDYITAEEVGEMWDIETATITLRVNRARNIAKARRVCKGETLKRIGNEIRDVSLAEQTFSVRRIL